MEENKAITLNEGSEDARVRIRFIISNAIPILIVGILLVISSGRLDWILGWTYLGINLAGILINAFAVSPSVLKDRMVQGKKEGIKTWDMKLVPPILLFGWFVAPFVAGLDTRFGWTGQIPSIIPLAFIAVYIIGDALFIWAMAKNNFFDTVVRIQGDRHTVARGGPYRYVRHPGYVGMILMFLALPLALGSFWALVPCAIGILLLIVRTSKEDKALQEELAGYREYARGVRYRLIPGVW